MIPHAAPHGQDVRLALEAWAVLWAAILFGYGYIIGREREWQVFARLSGLDGRISRGVLIAAVLSVATYLSLLQWLLWVVGR